MRTPKATFNFLNFNIKKDNKLDGKKTIIMHNKKKSLDIVKTKIKKKSLEFQKQKTKKNSFEIAMPRVKKKSLEIPKSREKKNSLEFNRKRNSNMSNRYEEAKRKSINSSYIAYNLNNSRDGNSSNDISQMDYKAMGEEIKYTILEMKNNFLLENNDGIDMYKENKKNEDFEKGLTNSEILRRIENPELIKNNFKNKLKKIPTKEELSPLYKEEKEKKINQSSIKHKFITNEILKCGDTKDKFEIKKDMKTLIEEKFRVYRQGGQIEDSYNESESDEEGEPDNFLINPETNIFFIYDTIIVFIAVYSLAAISYQITGDCFCQENHNNLKFFFELISDIIFLIDLIINFFLEYYTETNKLIKNRKKIIKNYLRGWFFFDFLSALPMNIIYYYYCKIYEFPICHTYERNGLVSALLLLKCLKTIKIFKIPVTKKNQFISYLAELASDETTENVNLTIELLLVIFGLHILSCIHIFIGKHTYPGWIYANNFQDYSVLNLYMISVYYLITTMTTVGYGDISSVIYRNHFSHYTSSSRYYLLLLAN